MEDATHEVTAMFDYGSITIQVEANFYGEGTVDEGVEEMVRGMFPDANTISVCALVR